MSLRDDFLEALRSVKRDFVRDYDPEPENTPAPPREAAPEPVQEPPQLQPEFPAEERILSQDEEAPEPTRMSDDEIGSLLHERSSIMDNFQPELHKRVEPEERDDGREAEPPNYQDWVRDEEPESRDFTEEGPEAPDYASMPDEYLDEDEEPFRDGLAGRFTMETFDSDDETGDERTVISKNTIVRGAIQTDDSMRLFGQILGDIDCRSNILVAGKVRGNTSAANAYIINAQVDGNLLCDDVINVTDDAWVLGNIRAQQAEIDGKIKGNIEIRHSISIGSNSSVIGNISTDELEIRRGAFVNGQIMMYSPSRDVIDRFDQFDQ